MQLLTSKIMYDRVGERAGQIDENLDFLVMDKHGAIARADGSRIEQIEVDPEIFWVSHDIVLDGLQPAFCSLASNGVSARWMQVVHAGVEHVDFQRVSARGVTLSKGSGQAPAIAEFVMSQVIYRIHPFREQQAAQASHEWRRIPFLEIGSTRWLLIGFGAVGQEIAKRAVAFGASLTVIRRAAMSHPKSHQWGTIEDLPKFLPLADVVVLACSLNDQTRLLADRRFFHSMKPGSILVNIGRGALVDEEALKSSLDDNKPGHAVLDVFQTEPLPPESWFWSHLQVTVTAHTAFNGSGTLERNDELFLENLGRFRRGERLLNEI